MTAHLVVPIVAMFMVLVGCSSAEHLESAERAVTEFRQQMANQQFKQIYAEGSEELRKSVAEDNLVKILGAIQSKLGAVRTVQRSTWNVNFHTSGTFVSLGFNTEFTKGAGTEQFVYRIVNGRPALVSYNVNSPALLIN